MINVCLRRGASTLVGANERNLPSVVFTSAEGTVYRDRFMRGFVSNLRGFISPDDEASRD